MDLKRLLSGKSATSKLVVAYGALVYNILRFVGQTTLAMSKGIIRHEATHTRIKAVIHEMIYFAGRMIDIGRCLKLKFSHYATPHVEAFAGIYARLVYG